MIKQQWHYQRDFVITFIQVTLHGGGGIAHQPKGHILFRRTLMFNYAVDIAVTFAGFYRPQNIRVVSA